MRKRKKWDPDTAPELTKEYFERADRYHGDKARMDYKARTEAKMTAFDQLPKIVRAALTNSQFNWNVQQLYQAWCERHMTARQLVRHIRSEDRIRLFERRVG